MAISHALQPLLHFHLLVSLFVLPVALAASVSDFRICQNSQQSPIKVNAVEVSPYPFTSGTNANFTITGFTSQELPNDAEVSVGLTSDGRLGTGSLVTTLKRYSLCDITTSCPVAPGSIVLTFSNIFIPQDLLQLIGKGYYVLVRRLEMNNSYEPMMCIMLN
ncbi:unnamed protein product [Brassica oleracea var. botrytis]|uniref:BnaC01g44270D protein n=2 Tax=Brassica napus TaxID=3708 RepID=A0A078IHZ9_BRANA|nr:MD-2-related lipid-recognition protein ROSY1 [Brassica napus]KAH0904477.1 hypothetical protein HID58_043980 [Brassica napus]CAF2078498.1 unnamed protein product [Brassica napus]CDY50625.1 BnaC01g44270D [Brassica napus]